jgi:hypothetical protein
MPWLDSVLKYGYKPIRTYGGKTSDDAAKFPRIYQDTEKMVTKQLKQPQIYEYIISNTVHRTGLIKFSVCISWRREQCLSLRSLRVLVEYKSNLVPLVTVVNSHDSNMFSASVMQLTIGHDPGIISEN